MPRIKLEDIKSELAAESKRASLLHTALTLALCEKPDLVEKVKVSAEESYEYHLYGCQYSHGGLVVRVFSFKGQSDMIEASYLDDMTRFADSGASPWPIREAVGRMRRAQREIVAGKGWHPCGVSKGRKAFPVKAVVDRCKVCALPSSRHNDAMTERTPHGVHTYVVST